MSRRSRDEDDDVDDRPRFRRRSRDDDPLPGRRRKRLSPVVILGVAGGAFAMLLVVGIVIYVIARDASKPAGIDLVAHMPADATSVSGCDLEELLSNEPFRKILEVQYKSADMELNRIGVRESDISSFVSADGPGGPVLALRFKVPPVQNKYLGAVVPGKLYSTFTSTSAYKFGYFADGRTLVLATSDSTIHALRDRNGKMALTGDMKDLVDRVRGPIWRVSRRPPTAGEGTGARIGNNIASAAWVERSGEFGDVRIEMRFETAALARTAATTLRGILVQQRGMATEFGGFDAGNHPGDWESIRRGYDDVQVTESGTRVTARLRLPATEALRLVHALPN